MLATKEEVAENSGWTIDKSAATPFRGVVIDDDVVARNHQEGCYLHPVCGNRR